MEKLSIRATLLLTLVLSLTAWNILRLWTSLAWRYALTEFAGAQIFAVAAISAAMWSVVGICSAWFVLQGKTWAGSFISAAAILYSLWYWVERLLWQNPRPNWLFAVIANLILLVLILLITKSRSREAYEQNIENSEIE